MLPGGIVGDGGGITGDGIGEETRNGGGDVIIAGGTTGASVSRNGDSTLPTLPLMLNTSVSASAEAMLPEKKVKLSSSPPSFAYKVI